MYNKNGYITVDERKNQKKKYTLLLIFCVLGLLFFIAFLPILGEYLSAKTMLRFIFPLATVLTVAILILDVLLWRSILKINHYKIKKKTKK